MKEMAKHLRIYEKRIKSIEKRKLFLLQTAPPEDKELLKLIFFTLQMRGVSPLQEEKYLRTLREVYKVTTLSLLNSAKVKEIAFKTGFRRYFSFDF